MFYFTKAFTTVLLLTVVSVLAISNFSFATLPPERDLLNSWNLQHFNSGVTYDEIQHRQLPRRDLSNYIGQLQRTCMFLDSMQEHDADSPNFGGLHEGETQQLWSIVETDNTQEAIRVWCEYALYFDDRDLYRQNVEDAWTYTDSFPAWNESEPGEYYGLHNSGWGLVAEMGYRRSYNEDDRRFYGIACADYLVENTPEIQPNMEDRLMPLVAGWAAGTLYEYGIFEDNDNYRNAASEIGSQVQAWIDEDISRLNRNEIWALCGGTAMWGVLHSLGYEDSAETADWSQEILENMDVFAGHGRWNNSWNIWYGHAWLAAYKLTGEQDYLRNLETIVDSLKGQDGDLDGGIPATGGNPDNADESWVSAYTAWMGLRQLFDLLPPIDASLLSLQSPQTARPWPVGEPIQFAFLMENSGLNDQITAPFKLASPINREHRVDLDGWQTIEFICPPWTPEETGDFTVTTYIDHEDDSNKLNDTLRFDISILPVGTVRLSTDADPTEINLPVNCRFDLYHYEIDPQSVFTSVELDTNIANSIESDIMVGTYRLEAIPAFPYPRLMIDTFRVGIGMNTLTVSIPSPEVLLVNNNVDTSYAQYYKMALDELNLKYYLWYLPESGNIPSDRSGFELFKTIIYFTGDKIDQTISMNDRTALTDFLDNGGNLFVSGQNVSDDLADDPFLFNVLHSSHLTDGLRGRVVDGIVDDEVFDGSSMLIFGDGGAWNQESPAGIAPTNGGIAGAYYRDRGDTVAVVHWQNQESSSKMVFFAFGFEAISERLGETRVQIMSRIFNWFNGNSGIEIGSSSDGLPRLVTLSAYPNPSNGAINIHFDRSLKNARAKVLIYSVNGQLVDNYAGIKGNRMQVINQLPTGLYFAQLTGDNIASLPIKITFIK